MPYYYFDVRDDDRLFTDTEGTELAGQVEWVRAEALGTLVEYAKGIHLGSGGRRVAVEVRCDDQPLLKVEMMLNAETRMKPANSQPVRLAAVQKHFQEGEARILRQRALVQRLSQGGMPTAQAEDLLALFESVQKHRARQVELLQPSA